MKKYYFDVKTTKKTIMCNRQIIAVDEADARQMLYFKLLMQGLLNDNRFYKLELKLVTNWKDNEIK